jgi:hypothetical protein
MPKIFTPLKKSASVSECDAERWRLTHRNRGSYCSDHEKLFNNWGLSHNSLDHDNSSLFSSVILNAVKNPVFGDLQYATIL